MLSSDDIPTPTPTLIMEVSEWDSYMACAHRFAWLHNVTAAPHSISHDWQISARPDLIPFEFHEKVTFEVHLPDNYPAYPPEVTYRSATRASDPGRFDKPIIEKYMVKKEAEGGSSTELKVVIPLLRPKEETAWSRACAWQAGRQPCCPAPHSWPDSLMRDDWYTDSQHAADVGLVVLYRFRCWCQTT